MNLSPEMNLFTDTPGWVRWIAQDSDGAWWGYSVEPHRNDHGWYENEVGEHIRLGDSIVNNWQSSLQKISDQVC